MRTDRSTRRRRYAAPLAVVALVAALAGPGTFEIADATTGDVLASFDASATAGVPGCSVNTGVAFDGEDLILSCWYTQTLYFVDATTHAGSGSVTIPTMPGGIGAIAYDATRDRLWACSSSDYSTVVLLDLHTGTIDPSAPRISTMGCIDGLAYDASDDTLWTSFDVSATIQHYGVDGLLIASRDVMPATGYCGNSGIAVGGPELFLGNNGCSAVYRAAKDLSSHSLFASLSTRVEDMECDDRTFPGKGAMWVQDAYDRVLVAFEIEPGLCRFGGGAARASAESYGARTRVTGAAIDTGTAAHTTAGLGERSENAVAAHTVPGAATVAAGKTTAQTSDPADPVTVSHASARLADVSLLDGLVTAEAVVAQAEARFDREAETSSVSSAGSRIVGLRINGEAVEGPIEPNTTITLPGVATIVLREELRAEGDGASIRVNMIHATAADGQVESIVSSAFASAGSGDPAPGPVAPEAPDAPDLPETPEVPSVPRAPNLGDGPSFTNGFEEADAPWTATGSWQIGAPGAGDPPPHGGTRIAGTILGGWYPNYDNSTLGGPAIDLTGYDPADPSPVNPYAGTAAHLRYHQTFSSEGWYDCGFIQVSVDDGATWSAIEPLEGYNYTTSASCGGLGPSRSFSGWSVDAEWTPYTLDLTPYAGEQVRLRFRFGSDGSVTDTGWNLDDFALSIEDADA